MGSTMQQYPEVTFRCSAFRHLHNVDHIPTESSATSLAQFLQAEMQSLDTGGGGKRLKVAKAQEQQEQQGDGKGKEGKGKQKPSKGKAAGSSSSGNAGGKGKGCYHWMTPSGCRLGTDCRFRHDREALNSSPDIASRCFVCSGLGHRANECNAPNNHGNEQGAGTPGNGGKAKGGKPASKNDGKGSGVVKKVEEDQPSTGTAQLISAAGQLLDQLQVKALKEVLSISRLSPGRPRTGLIDSGASSCLRQARGNEAEHLFRRTVDLAQGTAELLVTPCGTLVSKEEVETIVALGPLIRLGCRLEWGDRTCVLWHPKRGQIQLDISTGCPRVDESLALEFIQEIEAQRVESVGAAIKAIQAQEAKELPSPEQALRNLSSAIERGLEVSARLGEAVLALWPKVPKPLLRELTTWPEEDHRALHFNRRKRKALERAKKVLLHLFAGDSRKEIERGAEAKGYEVLSVGEAENLLAGQTFRYVLELAAAGKFDAIWAAPPCGTNTLCRYVEPGPPPLRSRNGDGRWGLPGLSVLDQKKVQISDELYLRCLLVMLVSQEGRKRNQRKPTWSLAENPQDPDEYLDPEAPLRKKAQETGGLASWFATDEFRAAAKLLDMKVYTGDQGPYGHQKRKPTGWGSTKPLPNLLKGPGTGCVRGELSSGEWESKTWAKWAGGMIDLLLQQLDEGEKLGKVEFDWQAHIAAGHWPPYRRCRTCIMSSARHRAHHRITNPASWTLSFDVIGPYRKACDETDRDLRFALVACLVVPVDSRGRPVLGPEQTQAESGEDQPEPSGEEAAHDEDARDLGDELGLMSIEDPEIEDEVFAPDSQYEECKEKCIHDACGLTEEELSCRVPGLAWKEVLFIETLRKKTPSAVVQGASRILAEIRELGFPVSRFHTDAGTEFISTQFRSLATKHGVRHTCAAPEEPSSNGRVESAIGRVKSLAKGYIHSLVGGQELWPLAVRSAVATMKVRALKGMGFPTPAVVPFGTRVQVLTRSWLRRQKKDWHLKAADAVVLCPAALVKLGYVVRVGKQLAVVTKLFHGEDPKIIPHVEVSGDMPPKMGTSLEKSQDAPPVAHSVGPEARITGKSSIPDMSRRPPPSTRFTSKAPAPGRVPIACKLSDEAAERAEDESAAELASQPHLDMEEVLRFIKGSTYLQRAQLNSPKNGKLSKGWHYVFGAFRHGGVVGITKNCKLRPGMASLLNAIARHKAPEATYTTAILSLDGYAMPHKDSNNLATSTSYWVPLDTPERGGRLWTEVKQGSILSGQPLVVPIHGKPIVGQLHSNQDVVSFSPANWHGTEAWDSRKPRIVLLLYTVGCIENLSSPHEQYLRTLGFPMPAHSKGGGSPISSFTKKIRSLPQFKAPEGNSHDPSAAGVHCAGSGEGLIAGVTCDSGSGLQGSTLGSTGVCGVGSGEGSVEGSVQGWCHLCEDWVDPMCSSECNRCGCSFQQPLKEECAKISQIQIKTQKTQKPNKNCIAPNKNSSFEEAALDPGDSSDSAQSGEPVEWIQGSGMVVASVKCSLGDGSGDEGQVIVMNPEGGRGDRLSCNTFEGQHEAHHEPQILEGVVVDVKAGSEALGLNSGPEADELGHDPCGLSGDERVLEHDGCKLDGVGVVEHDGCKLDGVGVVEHDGCELDVNVGVDGHAACERGCDVGLIDSCSRECDREDTSASAAGVESDEARNEAADQWKACAGVHEVEDLHGSVVDELRAIDVVGPRQRDIEDFSAWLDESQLRLAAYHEEALHGWIEGSDVEDAEAAETRDQLNRIWQGVEDIRHELRALCVDQLEEDLTRLESASAELSAEEQIVLQTRVVANWEVSQCWELWKPAAVAELDELTVSKGALESSSLDKLRELELRGCKVIQLPSKLVCSLKAPAGRRKVRLVACGNYMALIEKDKRSHREVVHASATSVEALRTCVSWSVRRRHILLTADIRAAFLNAQLLPRARAEAEKVARQDDLANGESCPEPEAGVEIIALIPPRLLVSKGLVDVKTRFVVRKALYGLDQAPRDWSLCRDTKLGRAKIVCDNVVYRLYRSFVEDNVWLVHHCEPKRGFEATMSEGAQVQGVSAWIIIYVDDILVGGPRSLAEATMNTIRGLWECSDPEEVGHEKAVRFLGLDLIWLSDGLLALGQESYLQDLVARYSEEIKTLGHPPVPLAPAFDEELVEEHVRPEQLKKAQGILGELLWASIRTRPDITYAVSRLASRTTKAPNHVYQAALHTLAYLSGSIDQVLTYAGFDRMMDPEDQRRTSLQGVIQGYGDASFAPDAKRSVQCLQVFTEGNLIAWSVARQPFMTVSSCEAEMIALLDLGCYTQAMAFLMDELIQHRSCKELLGDNIASLAIYQGVGSHWRTRHLRIKARTFHERNREGEMPAHHIAGERNPADIGTKSLSGARHWKLCPLLGLQPRGLRVKKVQGGSGLGVTLRECLLAVILACCLRTADAQPKESEASGDRLLMVIVIMIIISAIGVWECLRGLISKGMTCRRGRGIIEGAPGVAGSDAESEGSAEPQPEDELVDGAHEPPPPEPPVELIPDPPQPPVERDLRQRRGLPVYAPEPDDEPAPVPPPHPPAEEFRGVVLGRYADDVVIGLPQRVLGGVEGAQVQGIAPPQEPAQRAQGPDPPRVRIRDFEEVRHQILRENAERRALELPVQPPLVVNPTWGPAPNQPTLRQARRNATAWGGLESSVHHLPPAAYRADFYQLDLQRHVLVRWHCRARARLFTPVGTRLPAPIELRTLTGQRRSVIHEISRQFMIDDDFTQDRPTRAMQAEWRGRTELHVDVRLLGQLQQRIPEAD